MSGAWYDSLPDDYFNNETDMAYKHSFATIRKGLGEGLGFDEACERIDVNNGKLRAQIITDMIKVLIAEEHFTKRIPLEYLAERWQMDQNRIEKIKDEMLNEIQSS